MNSLFWNKKQDIPGRCSSQTNAEYSTECFGTWQRSTTRGKGLEDPCQNAFKDKPACLHQEACHSACS